MINEKTINDINKCIKKLAVTTAFLTMDNYIQHGDTTCLWHSIAVAYYSLFLVRLFHLRCNRQSLLMGALFHDYYLYDWHVKDPSHRFHGFRHPKTALKNTRKVRKMNEVEMDIIMKHMFPLTPFPPVYKESIIVCIVDKICSTYEVFCRNTYKLLKKECRLYSCI
ncbi:phosphohydrolase [Anaerocolumna sp. AGMB13025]|uniref:phosphohydrolase n=1 Tax=Anaerocolumna sp. AGMB13025 TaxID=3039116 RepID=UPI00241DD077|nr:phosphohydrolase [Anaerocolumna sp. AGMB13025]WFR56299.1 phosphohydrolase [Anaerocolumna sp. AGMB13025]